MTCYMGWRRPRSRARTYLWIGIAALFVGTLVLLALSGCGVAAGNPNAPPPPPGQAPLDQILAVMQQIGERVKEAAPILPAPFGTVATGVGALLAAGATFWIKSRGDQVKAANQAVAVDSASIEALLDMLPAEYAAKGKLILAQNQDLFGTAKTVAKIRKKPAKSVSQVKAETTGALVSAQKPVGP